jgi:hypothetical protein
MTAEAHPTLPAVRTPISRSNGETLSERWEPQHQFVGAELSELRRRARACVRACVRGR